MNTAYRQLLILLFSILAITLPARAENSQLRIAVRSEVERPFKGWSKAPLVEHGKVYYILSIKEVPPVKGLTQIPLVKPVDETQLRKTLMDELAKHDFREIASTETPEIILTVLYGRGYVENPYMDNAISNGDGVVTVAGIGSNGSVADSRSNIYQEKLQIANHEKLFIRITAWSYPDQILKKQKSKLLWKTTVLIDDPADRDLNQFINKMLAAASSFFDQPMKDKEQIVRDELPEGYVHWGEATVLADRVDESGDGK